MIRPAAMMHARVMLMLGMRVLLRRFRREQRLHDSRRAEHELQLARIHRKHEASRDERPRHEQRDDPEAQQFEVMAAHDSGRSIRPLRRDLTPPKLRQIALAHGSTGTWMYPPRDAASDWQKSRLLPGARRAEQDAPIRRRRSREVPF